MGGNTIKLLLTWLPALLLFVALGWGAIIGLIRGFRKSLVLGIHALAAALICLGAYLIIVNMDGLDAWAFNNVNAILSGSGTSLQEMLEVSPDCATLTDVLIEFIPKNMDFGDGMALVFKDNGAYLATIVDLCYHIIFAIVFYVFYFVLLFILYIVYFIFYPERRRKKKIKERYRNAEETSDYRKLPLFGAIIGGIRSLVEYTVFISFLGILLFTLGGGLGEREYEEYDFGDTQTNNAYNIYSAVGSYGSNGIFKILNTVKDSNDFPYYLYIADLVFQGGLKDDNRGINTNISIAREFGAYVGFSNDAINLLFKYDDNNEIQEALKKDSDIDIMDVASKIMAKPEFQAEFATIIDNFESEEYFINFALSLVDSIVAHRKDLTFFSGMDEQTMELFDIMFDGENKITVSSLLTKDDAKVLLKTCINMLSAGSEYNDLENEEEKSLRKALSYCKVIIPEIEKLSIFEDETRKNNLNAVLKELYDYLAQKIANEENKTTESLSNKAMKLTNTSIDDVDWIGELKGLLDISLNVVDLYDRIYTPDKEVIDLIFDMFKGENATKNEQDFDNITNVISDSKLAGVVLSMSFVNDTIEQALGSMIEGFELIPNIQYNNDGDKKGEIYYLLTSVKHLIKNDAKDVFTSLTEEGKTTADMLDSVKNLVEILESSISTDTTLLDQMLKSDLLSYTLSSIMLNLDLGDEAMKIYVPDDLIYNIRETEEKNYKSIKNEDLSDLVSTLTDVIDVIKPALDENDEIDIMLVLTNDNLSNSLKSSVILEGTISNLALVMLDDFDGISVPNSLAETEYWLSTDTEDGEIVKIIDGINASNIDLNSLMNSESGTNDILDLVLSLNEAAEGTTETKLDLLYKSLLLRATLATQIDSAVSSMIDSNVLNSSEVKYQTNDSFKDIYYKQTEIEGVIDSINVLGIESLDSEAFNADVISDKVLTLNEASDVAGLTKLDVLYTSSIIKYVLADTLDDVLTTDIISTEVRDSSLVKETAQLTSVIDLTKYDAKSYKKEEISNVISSLDELEITSLDSESISADSISDKVLSLNEQAATDTSVTKLDVLYSSQIIKYVLANSLDDVLTADIVSTEVRDSGLVKESETLTNVSTNAQTTKAYYSKSEMSNVISSLDELDITSLDSESISADSLSDKVLSLNEQAATDTSVTKLDVLYSSYLIKYILAEAVGDNLSGDGLGIHDDVINSIKLNDEIDSSYYYKKSEIKLLLDALGDNGLDVTDIDELTTASADIILDKNVNEIPEGQSESRLAVIYKSVLIKDVITTKLDEALVGNTLVVVDPQAKDIVFNTNIKFYNQNEISVLLDFMNKHASSELGAIDIATMTLDSTDIDLIVASKILYATTSKHIIDNTTLVKPDECIVTENSINKIKEESEMKAMLNAIITICSGSVNAGVDLELSDSKIEILCSSDILRATISDKVINNSAVIVPNNKIDTEFTSKKVIVKDELDLLLKAVLNGLGVSDVEGFNSDSIAIPESSKLDILTNSEIMRATITKNVKASNSSGTALELYVENNSNYVEKSVDHNNTNILVLSKNEIVSIVDAIKIINGDSSTKFEIEISIEALLLISDTDVDTALQSSMVHLLIADFLADYNSNTMYGIYSYTPTQYSVYNISSIELNDTYETMSVETIKSFLDYLESKLGI